MANSGSISGVEAMFSNVAGLSYVGRTQLSFSNTRYLEGADITINAIGLGQKLGESGVLGLSVMTMNVGDLSITNGDQPAGGFGTFAPSLSNVSVSFAKSFSNSIFGGLSVRVLSETIADLRTSGVSFDAGIHYVTGPADNVHFGIALRNVGPPVGFEGDGLTTQGFLLTGQTGQLSLEQRSESFELPSLLNIGLSYDFLLSERHALTLAGTYVSNSFTRDNLIVGAEYSFNKIFMLRGAYLYEDGITSDEERSTVYTGISGGLSVELPFGNEKASDIAFDYSYRATNPFGGTHSVGIRIELN